MKHLYRIGLLFLGMFVLTNLSWGQNTLIISQYIETNSGSTPKGIELWNVSGSTIDFSSTSLDIQVGINGGTPSSQVTVTSGTLADGEVMVVGTSDMGTYLTNEGLTSVLFVDESFTFNGDDAIVIVLSGSTEDMFGTAGVDPGSAWSGSGVETRNNNISLLSGITVGDTDGWTDPSTRFETTAGGTDLTGFGIAPAAPSTNTQVQFTSASASVAEDGTSLDLTLGITNEDGSSATTVEVALTSGDAADINSYTTQTATFAAGSSADETVTITITDDMVFEGDETLTFTLQNVAGGNSAELGSQTTFDLTITDNEPLPSVSLPYSESFDTDLNGVLTFSVASNADWEYDAGVASIGNFGADEAAEDWLITPEIDLTSASDPSLSFTSWTNFTDITHPTISALVSTDYSGTGTPVGSTWVDLSATFAAQDSETITPSGDIDLSAYNGSSIYIAFRYTASGTGGGATADWEIDDIVVEENPILPEPTNHVTSFAAATGGAGSINLTWTDNDGAQAAENFLIKASTVSAGDITDPVDGTAEADDALVANVASGAGSVTFSGLASATQYFFKIYPYTNAGSDIDFKTDATVPEADATSGAIPNVVINEVDADPTGTDVAEYIELYDGGIGNTSLDGLVVVLMNGSDDASYGAFDLDGMSTDADGFFILGNSGIVDKDFDIGTSNIIQNGADAVALYVGSDSDYPTDTPASTTNLIDAVAYDTNDGDDTGLLTALGLTTQYNEDENGDKDNQSISRNPDFTGDFATLPITPRDNNVCTSPGTQATSLNFTAVGDNTITANWTRGNGDEVIVIAKATSAVDADPEDGTAYTANAAFGTGDELGTGNFVVYTGTATSIALTSLTQGTEYHFAVYEYNTADNCYNQTPLTGSQSTTTPNDTNSDITALAAPIAQNDISSLIDTDAEAIDVFGFTLTDEGTDGLTTSVDAMAITAGTNNTADWSATLAGAVLSDGTTDYDMTIAAGTLTLDLTSSEYVLANGTSQEFTLSIWFNTEVTDGEILEFEIPTDHDFSALTSGSIFLTDLTGAVTSSQHTVDVDATVLSLDVSSIVGIATDFNLTATAEDANGNVDLAARNVSVSKTSGSGDLTGTGLTAQAMTDGVFTWSDLELSAADDYVLTVDDDGSALTATANVEAAEITGGVFFSEYIEGSSNNKAIEIYNGTGVSIDLSNYQVRSANNGNGFGNGAAGSGDFPDAYDLTLSGTLDAGDVYVIYNGSASLSEIISAGDIAKSFGDNPGDRIAAFNGDDALGLFQNGVLIDVFGDPAADPGSSWPVAGTGATANFTLVRKGSITEGNTTPLGSFGTDADDSEWIVNDQDNVNFIGFHLLDGETLPLITLDASSFEGGFGFIELGQSSDPSSYDVTTTDLTADLVITPPVGFEISGSMDFSTTIYTNSAPWSITPTDGAVSQTVYVRFTPLAADVAYGGDITHTSTDADSKTVTVSGTEGVFDTAPSISGVVINEVLPDPNVGSEGYDTDGNGTSDTQDEFVEIYNSSDSPVDISGWQFWDETEMFFEFPAATTLGAGNYAGVLAGVQDGGTLPTPSTGNLAFETAGEMSLSNGGENVALYNPNSGEYIQIKYGDGEADADIGSGLSGATLNGIIEAWGGDQDGTSLVREPAGDLNIAIHSEIQGADRASFAEPTIDPNAPLVTVDAAALMSNFGNVLIGQESMTSTYTVSGTNLEADIVITAPTAFQISQDGTTFSSSLNLTPTANEVSATTITVKYLPSAEGSQDGTIVHTTTNGPDNEVDVAGAGITDATIFFEGFGSCDGLNGFDAQSVTGDEAWACTDFGETGSGVRMSGFNSGAQENEDWLVTPSIDLATIGGAELSFDTDVQFDGAAIEAYVATDYAGDATTATWVLLDAVLDTDTDGDTWTSSGLLSLPVGTTINVGFKYVSTTEASASWSIDNVKVTETQPFFAVDNTGFNGDFGQQDVGTTSLATSFTVEGFGLTADVTVTPPAQFEVSTSSDFASTGTSAAPLTISPADGAVDQEVFVRFAPSTPGTFSGNVTVSTTGFDNATLSVSGVGEEETVTLGLDDEIQIVVFPNPIQDAFEILNKTGRAINLEVFALDGSRMKVEKRGDVYSIASFNSGVYVLVVKDSDGNELSRQQIIKE